MHGRKDLSRHDAVDDHQCRLGDLTNRTMNTPLANTQLYTPSVAHSRQIAPVLRPPMTHVLKVDPEPFDLLFHGLKTFELRRKDRDYRIGDTLLLLRTFHSGKEMAAGAALKYTGAALAGVITHIQTGYDMPEHLCGLSLSIQVDLVKEAVQQVDLPQEVRNLILHRPDIPGALRFGDIARQVPSAAAVLREMTLEECEAALRFHETAQDDGTYDIPNSMRKRLTELGLIHHAGGGFFQETGLMLAVIDVLGRQEIN